MSKRKGETIQAVRRKIRIISSSSSSSSEDESSNRPNDLEDLSGSQMMTTNADAPPTLSSRDEEEDSRLDDVVLALLGDAPKSDAVLGKAIHKDISERWREILSKGLERETKDKLLQEYLIPSNCEMLLAPKLNAEIKTAIAENITKRDYALEFKQNQMGIALAALSTAIDSVVKKDFTPQSLLKPISDACRILCDSHFNETKTRRHFVLSSINSEMKDTLSVTVRDRYLFGEDITDKIKSAKIIKKSGTDLKPTTTAASYNRSQKFNKNNFVKNRNQGQSNWRPLQRRTGKADAGSRVAQYQHRSYHTRSGPQHREAARSPPPPPPPPRQQQRARRRQ